MLASPPGKITMSPACMSTAGSGSSTVSTQQEPDVRTWNAIRCSASAATLAAITSVGGLCATNGARASMS